MKVRYICAALLALSLYSCDDSTKSLGNDLLPPTDNITVKTKEYTVLTKSVSANSVYAKTDEVYIGRYSDEDFGDYEASFLTQLNCVDSLLFPAVYDDAKHTGIMTKDETELTEVIMSYTSFVGDSIAPSSINIYELNKALKTDHYTDITPEEFYDPNTSRLSQASYSGKNLSDMQNQENKETPFIRFELDKSVGDNILKLNRSNPEFFHKNKAFVDNVFAGLYAKIAAGGGSVLFINAVQMNVVYDAHYIDSIGKKILKKDGTDSIYKAAVRFTATKEIVQANKLVSDAELLNARIAETSNTYVKSPAGIFTEVTLPIDQIMKDPDIKEHNIVNGKLVFQSYVNRKGGSSFELKRPRYLALLKKSEYEEFFEKNKIFDYKTSFYGELDAFQQGSDNNGVYRFSNLENLIVNLQEEKIEAEKKAKEEAGDNWNKDQWEEEWLKENPDWNKLLLVPVDIQIVTNNNGSKSVISVKHNLRPESAKLVGGVDSTEDIKLRIVTTKFDENMGI